MSTIKLNKDLTSVMRYLRFRDIDSNHFSANLSYFAANEHIKNELQSFDFSNAFKTKRNFEFYGMPFSLIYLNDFLAVDVMFDLSFDEKFEAAEQTFRQLGILPITFEKALQSSLPILLLNEYIKSIIKCKAKHFK